MRAGALLLAILALAAPAAASCPYPLGLFAARGDIALGSFPGGTDNVEAQIIDATGVAGQQGYGQVVEVAGQLKLVYEAEVEWAEQAGGTARTRSVLLKEYSNDTGWDVPVRFLASDDVNVERPEGRNGEPYAAALGPDLVTVWEASGRVRPNGSYILGRTAGPDGIGQVLVLSDASSERSDRLPKVVGGGAQAYIAYQSAAPSLDPNEFAIVGRTFDGTALGPLERISIPGDGWSDETVALSTDGTRVFAAWASQNLSYASGDGEWSIQAAVRGGDGNWSLVVPVTQANRSGARSPSIAWYSGQVAVVWSSNDPAFDARGDFDIYMRILDPQSLGLSATVSVSTADYEADERDPAAAWWPVLQGGDGLLHILFASNSRPAGSDAAGTEYDVYSVTFNGAGFSAALQVSDARDDLFDDVRPGLFAVDGALHAYYMSDLCQESCASSADWREVTRLLTRPTRPYDLVEAEYTVRGEHQPSFPTSTNLTLRDENGTPASGEGYMVRLPDGTVVALELEGGAAGVAFVFDSGRVQQLQASYCGAPVLTHETLVLPPPLTPPTGDGLLVPALVGALAAAGVGAWVLRRRRA
jgi:hypothetical protein